MRSSPQQQRRGLDRQATLHTIYEEKDSKYGGYSGEHPTKFLWKTIEKNIKFDSFLYAFWERGDDELLHVQRRMHPEAPESSRKAERLRIKPGDSNIKVIHWFKMNLQQYVKTFFTYRRQMRWRECRYFYIKMRRLRDIYPAHYDRRIPVRLKKTINTVS